MEELIFKEDVYAIIGAAIEVHRILGHGFLEPVYQEALEIESRTRNLPFEAQKLLQIHYKEHLLKKEYIADLVYYGRIIESTGCTIFQGRRPNSELSESHRLQTRLAHQFWFARPLGMETVYFVAFSKFFPSCLFVCLRG